MLPAERRQRILDIIRVEGSVTVTVLSEKFSVSEETIRRDLQQMEQESLLSRVYGGAYLGTVVHQEIPHNMRKNTCPEEKNAIANICCEMINNGDTIMLDSSTTAYFIAEKIKTSKSIIVITNSLDIAATLSSSTRVKVVCAGGDLNRDLLSFIGPSTLSSLNKYYADKAFVSCTGISIENGITDSNEMQGEVRKKMLAHSQQKILIADHTKFHKTTLSYISDIDILDSIVTDKPLSDKWILEFEKRNIKYYFNQQK